MSMLDGPADRNEEFNALSDGQPFEIAITSNRYTFNQFHNEIGKSRGGRTSVENMCNIRVVHQRKRLTLALKARDHLFAVHARLNDLECNVPADGFELRST